MRLGMPGFLTRGLGSRLIRRALRGGTRPGPGAAYPKPTAVATPPPRLSPALRSLRIRPCARDGRSMGEVERAGIDFIALRGGDGANLIARDVRGVSFGNRREDSRLPAPPQAAEVCVKDRAEFSGCLDAARELPCRDRDRLP